MKKRLCLAVSLVLLLSLAVPVLAAEDSEPAPEPEYRLAELRAVGSGGLTFSYDAGEYLPSAIYALEGLEPIYLLDYDDAGRVISCQGPDKTYTRTYDSNGYLLEETSSSLTMIPDEAGTPVSMMQQSHTLYTYDNDGHVLTEESEISDDSGTSTVHVAYSYGSRGNILKLHRESSYTFYGEEGSSVTDEEYTYDEHGSCTRLTRTRTSGGESQAEESAYEYAYDADGAVTSKTMSRDGEEIAETIYVYGEDGSRTETVYADGEQIQQDIYDREERVVSSSESSGYSYQYYYLPLMKLVCVTDEAGSSYVELYFSDNIGTQIDSFSYGVEGIQPQITRDENGYLTLLDFGTGSDGTNYTVTLTYEPVA